MNARAARPLRWLLAFALLGACAGEPPVRIGAKNSGESRVLAHMLAEMARARGF